MVGPEVSTALLDALHMGVALWQLEDERDPSSLRLEWSNAVMSRISGVDLSSLVGRRIREVSPAIPDERVSRYAEVAQTGRAGPPIAFESTGDGAFGAGRYVVSTVPLPGRRVAVLCEPGDIDTLETREVRASSRFLDSILENIPAMVFVKDAVDLRFRRFNKGGEVLLGLSRDALLGRSDYDFFPAEQADAFTAKDREVLAARAAVDIAEEPVQTARGERWLHTRKIPIPGEDGEPRYLLGISFDVTEERETRAALRRAHDELERRVAERTAQLEAANAALQQQIADRERTEVALRDAEDRFRQAQKMEAVGRLAGGIAHDFNNLLSVVIGYATLLEDDLPPTDRRRKDVSQIRMAGERAAALTGQLLAFSRQQVLAPKVVDLGGIIERMLPMITRIVGEDVQIETVLAPHLRPVRVDPNQIEQVIMNLVVNARDAMLQGGLLTIETAEVGAGVGQTERRVMLAVSDTGAGISADIRARMFDPFFTTKEVGKGTGLGLSTVLGIVEQSGGNVEVHSVLGRGTRFELFFPPASGSPDSDPPREVSPVGHETVLLVEDEEPVRTFACDALRRLGYRVVEAANASEALERLGDHPDIELLLSDVVMPGPSGLELAREVARRRPDVRVVFMSGYTADTMVRHGVFEDRVSFIQKPLVPAALAAAVRRALDEED